MSEKSKCDKDLDEALEETFPASDPIGVGSGFTGDEKDKKQEQKDKAKPIPPEDKTR